MKVLKYDIKVRNIYLICLYFKASLIYKHSLEKLDNYKIVPPNQMTKEVQTCNIFFSQLSNRPGPLHFFAPFPNF